MNLMKANLIGQLTSRTMMVAYIILIRLENWVRRTKDS